MSDRSLTTAVALNIARRWNPIASELEDLRQGENRLYRVKLRGKPFALRLTSRSHRTLPQIEAELAFVDHVLAGGLRVARPLSLPDGSRVLDVSDILPNAQIYASVFEWLPGRHFTYRSLDIDQPLFRLWGETMARLHERSATFVAPPNAVRPEWYHDPVAGCPLHGLVVSPEIAALREDLVSWLRDMPTEPAHYGMVHGDFERTNFTLDGDRLCLLDFDDCCRHWFVWDVACALWVFRNEAADNRERFLAWFIEGYTAVRELDTLRMAHFTDLIRLRTLALLLHRLRQPERFATDSDRKWIAGTSAGLVTP